MFPSFRFTKQVAPYIKNVQGSISSIATHAVQGAKVSERRVVSAEDVSTFAKLTGDLNTLHFGNNAIAHGVLINGFVSALLGTKLPGPGYAVVEQTMFFPNPCHVGEELEISVEVTESRKILTCKYICLVPERKCVVHEGIAKLVKMKAKSFK